MNVLISTIVRNEAKHLAKWHSQIKALVEACPDITFVLGVFENDSTDGSAELLRQFDYSFFRSHLITTGKINVPYFIGGKHPSRTALLAYARNRTLYGCPHLGEMDYVLVVEPDIEYSVETAKKLLYHAQEKGEKLDVFTGKSVHPGTTHLYDSWGTRKTSEQTDWRDEDGQEGGFELMWSTYNCLCLYNAEPIKMGHAFSGINPRTGQPDCDTVAICEAFRLAGYHKIYWDTSLHVTHFIDQ